MSIFDPGSDVPDAPTWRCPHCRTLQPETSRCRACLRATVTCESCRYFRPTLVSGLGLCANDPTRSPLSGDEVHPCWVAGPAARSGPGSASNMPTAVPGAGSMPPNEGLRDAPHVPPARRLTSEVRRRSERGRG